MGEIQRIKHQQALEYWSQILKEQQESGLCIKAFCRSRQMSPHAMYYWIKELREEALLVNPQALVCTTQFAPVSLAQEQHHFCGKMVVHVCSTSLEIPEKTVAPDLQRTLQVLKEVFLCQYILLHRKQLSAYLEFGEAAMTNNICERAIRNFTIGRKNWLFSTSPKEAEASATIYSIIETCKANGLEPYTYLTYLFEKLPNIDFKIHPDLL